MSQMRAIRAIWSFPAGKGAALILVVQHLEKKAEEAETPR